MPAPQWARPGFVGVCPRALREKVRAEVSSPNHGADANLFEQETFRCKAERVRDAEQHHRACLAKVEAADQHSVGLKMHFCVATRQHFIRVGKN